MPAGDPSPPARGGSIATLVKRTASVGRFLSVPILVLLSLATAVYVHLDTSVTKRVLKQYLSDYLDQELAGHVDLGTVERLDSDTVWLSHVAVYDVAHRRVLSVERLRVRMRTFRALWDALAKSDKLTIVVDSVAATGVLAELLPTGNGAIPSLMQAFEPDPGQKRAGTKSDSRPYRVALTDVQLSDVTVNNQVASLPIHRAQFKRLEGLVLATKEGAAVSIKRFGTEISLLSNLTLTGTTNLEFRSPDRVSGQFDARVGQIPVTGTIDFHGGELELKTALVDVTPAQAKSALPNWPLQRPLSVSLTTHGPLTALGVRVLASSEVSRAEIVGTAQILPELSGNFALSAEHLDLAAAFGASVSSDLKLRATVGIHGTGESTSAQTEGLVDGGTLLGQSLPVVDFDGKWDDEGLLFSLHSRSATLPIHAGLWMHQGKVEVDAQSGQLSLERLPSSFGLKGLTGTAMIRGRGILTGSNVALDAKVSLSHLRQGSLSAENGAVEATLQGPLNDPFSWRGLAQASLGNIQLPFASYTSFSTSLQGTAKQFHFHALARDTLGSKASLESSVTTESHNFALSRIRGGLERGTNSLSVIAASASISSDSISVKAAEVRGSAGDLDASVDYRSRGELSVDAQAKALNLSVLGDLLGLSPHQLAGTANGSLQLSGMGEKAQGHLQLNFERVSIGPATNLEGTWEQSLSGKKVTGNLSLSADLLDHVQVGYDLNLTGPITDAGSFAQVTGTVNGELTRFRLDRLSLLLGLLPQRMATQGTLNGRFSVSRTTPEQSPSFIISVASDGLGVRLSRSDGNPMSFEQATLLGNVNYDGQTNQLQSDWVLGQNQEPKAILGLTTSLDLTLLLQNFAVARSKVYELPFEAQIQIPRQSLSDLEPILGLPLGTGTVAGKLTLRGPATDPHFILEYRGEQLSLVAWPTPNPFDAQGMVEFAARTGETRLASSVGYGSKTWAQLDGTATLTARGNSKWLGLQLPDDWSGHIDLGLNDLPLDMLPGVSGSRIIGSLNGGATFTRADGKTRINAVVPINNLQINARPIGQALVSLQAGGKVLTTSAKLIDAGAQVDFGASIPVDLEGAVPTMRVDSPSLFSVQASGYDAGILAPVLDDYVTALQGELSCNLEARYLPPQSSQRDPTANAASSDSNYAGLALSGNLLLRHGRGRLRQLGVTLEGLSLDAQASSTGNQTLIHVSNISVAVDSNSEPNLKGAAVIELERFALKRFGANIEQADHLPLTLDGVTLAELTGTAEVELVPQESKQADGSLLKAFLVNAKVGQLDIKLPQEKAREVVALTENPDIVVTQPLGAVQYQKSKTGRNTSYRVKIALGKRARVMRSDFSLPISGTPSFLLADRLQPSGTVQLEPGGRLQLFGKTFIIEHGQLTLNPDEPNNPHFEVVAQWRGPSHMVTATVTGTRKEAELHWVSDPPLPSEAQVVALLVSGSGGDGSTTSAGLGVGATLFNEFMADTALSSLELRTSQDEQHANYTAAVPLKENLWFEGTYQSANSSSLRPSSSSAREGFSGTLDFRFRKNWSLRTEVGTLGAGADLLWQYRY